MTLLRNAARAQREAVYYPPYEGCGEWRWGIYEYDRLIIDTDENGRAIEWEHRVLNYDTTVQVTVPFDTTSREFYPDTLSIWLDLGQPSPTIICKQEFEEGDLDLLATLVDDHGVDISVTSPETLRVLLAMIEA